MRESKGRKSNLVRGGVLGDVVGESLDGDVLLGGEPVADFEKLDAALIEHLLQGIELLD